MLSVRHSDSGLFLRTGTREGLKHGIYGRLLTTCANAWATAAAHPSQ